MQFLFEMKVPLMKTPLLITLLRLGLPSNIFSIMAPVLVFNQLRFLGHAIKFFLQVDSRNAIIKSFEAVT